ncbi:Membrane-bound lytic murein transglycosylase D precursor [hydrothermal vent metagenome]|uniref:Membrane-bound lytic murein transglycosylase D n=1 Tax=hydrothermal vent metagenome TaxID=652676 RepID=A0A1W1CRP3_9ZZZZ
MYSKSLEEKYPSYRYVFYEFDVPESYIEDKAFIHFVNQHEKSMKRFYRNALHRGEMVLPLMQGQLLEEGVSDLFIYLSMVESGFSTNAVSSKKAVGLWQFMPATAKYYQLNINGNYDERYDTFSATSAAIKYLNRLYQQFGKWYLAAMAYNCGEGCVKKAILKAGSDDLSLLTDNHLKYLPKETRKYMKKILLVAMIGENSLITFNRVSKHEKKLTQVEVSSLTSLEEIAKLITMKLDDLLKLNPAFKNGKIPSGKSTYNLYIPVEKIYAFYLRYEMPETREKKVLCQKKEKKNNYQIHMITHRVKMGETLESIAKYYGNDREEIRKINHLEDESLTLGRLLVLYVSEEKFKNISK